MFLSTMMHEVGNPAAVQFNNDYTGASATFAEVRPPADEIWGVKLMTGIVEATTKFKPSDFGNITNGLTNGLSFNVSNDDGPYIPLGGGVPIKTNEDLFYLMTKIETSESVFDTVDYMYKFEVDFGIKGESIICALISIYRLTLLPTIGTSVSIPNSVLLMVVVAFILIWSESISPVFASINST